MSEQATQEMTNTVGYYNGFTYPIQLQITKLGIQLMLKPNEFVLDRLGRKVNDPFFDRYLNGGLKKETSEKAVPLIHIPPVEAPIPRSSNYAVRGTQNVNPTREAPAVPEPASPSPAGLPAANNPAIRGMSVEEARKMGLIKNTREVPEDYGPSDNDSGQPPKPASIKYAIDTVRSRKTELPPEALQEAQNVPQAAPLVQQLQQASTTPAAPENTGFLNDVIHSIKPEDAPLIGGTPQDEQTQHVQETVREIQEESSGVEQLTEEESVDDAESVDASDLPEPEIEEIGDEEDTVPTPEAVDNDADLDADVDDEDQAEEEDDDEQMKAPVPRRFKRPAGKTRFACPACGAPHKFRSQLVQHAQQSHPDQLNAILSQFPK